MTVYDRNFSYHFSSIHYSAQAVHCEWNDWVIGECSKSCGEGIRTNTRSVKTTAEHGGKECDGSTSIEEHSNTEECPGRVHPK